MRQIKSMLNLGYLNCENAKLMFCVNATERVKLPYCTHDFVINGMDETIEIRLH